MSRHKEGDGSAMRGSEMAWRDSDAMLLGRSMNTNAAVGTTATELGQIEFLKKKSAGGGATIQIVKRGGEIGRKSEDEGK